MAHRPVLAATLLAAAAIAMALPASADELHRGRDGRGGHHGGGYGAPGLPSVVPGLGTFSGNLAAVRIRGNGIYFAKAGNPLATAMRDTRPSGNTAGPKIIHVNAATAKASCRYEAGVCVIRP